MNRSKITPIIQALAAAILFGASAPLSKTLLGEVEPIPLAAFLYLGSGFGLLGITLIQRFLQKSIVKEAKIQKPDLPWLAGAILAGGVAAPITLLFSLRNTPAATASLLLNFESVATTLIAAWFFKEAISRRAWLAIVLITLSTILLSVNLDTAWGFSLGAFGIIAACIFWGIDNNFTRNISAKDPITIVTIKGLGAGSVSLILALIMGNSFPSVGIILSAMLLGSLSYGTSIVLFIHAMRGLGAGRTSALFSTAPLSGLLLSFILFRESPGWLFLAAFPLMVAGTLFLVTEAHNHLHRHEGISHEHAHVHDDGHHGHSHASGIPARHSHLHTHEALTHDHNHMPDTHHRHDHAVHS